MTKENVMLMDVTSMDKMINFMDELSNQYLNSDISTEEYWEWHNWFDKVVPFKVRLEVSNFRIDRTIKELRGV